MKFLFVTPLEKIFNCRWLPMGICSMAAILKEDGHEVRLVDRTVDYALLQARLDAADSRMLAAIKAFGPDVIGLSTVSPVIYDTLHCAELIRHLFSGPIIAGGYHASAVPELTLRKIDTLDRVLTGEGEYALRRFMNGENPGEISGFFPNPPERIEELDLLPFPDFGILNMDYYLKPNASTIRGFNVSAVSLQTSRGCRFNCTFCSENMTTGRAVRHHSAEYVFENIKALLKRYSFNAVYFHDNDFLDDPVKALTICRLLRENRLDRKIKWAVQVRSGSLTGDLAGELKKAGCVKVELGIESADDVDLRKFRKGLDGEQNIRAVGMCRKAGLRVHINLLYGLKDETRSKLLAQCVWIRAVKPDTLGWYPLYRLPGTELYEQEGCDFFRLNDWTKENVLDFYYPDRLSDSDTVVKPVMNKINRRSLYRNNTLVFGFSVLIKRLKNRIRKALFRK